MRNFIDEVEEEMYKGEDFVTLGLNKFYEFLASMEAYETNDIKDKLDKRIFNSAQEIEGVFGVKVVLRDNLPKNCNVVMYQLGEKPEIRPVDYFVENENGLFYITYNGKMEVQNDSLEDEVAWDYENLGHKTFIYLRLATKDNSDVFTPERLLGVETDKGFITNVVEIGFYDIMKPSYYVYTNESLSKEDLYDVHSIKYYISDDSDETVSFDEHIKLFYDVEGGL